MAWTANQKQYIAQILRGVGAPNTPANRKALAAWAQAEGGSAKYNPFNTTQSAKGASNYNSVGVKNYTSFQQGVASTIKTLKNGRYDAIIRSLRAGKNPQAVASAIEQSPWGTGGLVTKVLAGWGDKPIPGGVPTSIQHGGAQGKAGVPVGNGLRFDPELYHKKAATMLLANAEATARGEEPEYPDILTGLKAAKAASVVRVQGAINGGAGGKTPGAVGQGANTAVRLAAKQIGTPYVWGGETPGKGFDCSGLIQFAWGAAGVKLPRTAAEQGKAGKPVSFKNLKPGDGIVAKDGHHIVMYAGNGRVIAAPHTGTTVQYQPLKNFLGGDYRAVRFG